MLKIFLTVFLGIIIYSNCLAQFSPPGLGKVKMASWFAIGVKQNLNKKETINSVTHFGLGRISDPDNYNLFNRQSTYVVNEEVTHRFKKNWEYSLALSYRYQNRYKASKPYEIDIPKAREELRVYSRFSYINSIKRVDYSLSYRPEVRFFYNPNFTSATKNTQFRSRFRGKATFNLNALGTHKITTTAELLFSTTKTNSWSKFEYKETRLCWYYSITFPKQKIAFNLGYMNNLLGTSSITNVHYLAFDIMIKNPFEK